MQDTDTGLLFLPDHLSQSRESRGAFPGLENQAEWPLLSVFRLVETWHLFDGTENLEGRVCLSLGEAF